MTDNITDLRERQVDRELELEQREFAEAMSRARAVAERQWAAS
ncbi:hypothetical protein [Microbacterium sp. A1-JK]